MKKNNPLLVKFCPLQYYFFGGEQTLGGGNEQNYFAKSRSIPQQTTLLGSLRYQLLAENEALRGEKKHGEASKIVGENSFNYKLGLGDSEDEKDLKFGYGLIQNLSPLFLMKGEKVYIPHPKEVTRESKVKNGKTIDKFYWLDLNAQKIGLKNLSSANPTSIALLERCKIRTWQDMNDNVGKPKLKQWQNCSKIEPYSPKAWFQDWWINQDGEVATSDEIFGTKTQVGITKDGDEDAFYKQSHKYLKEGWSFAALLTLSDSDDYKSLPSSWTIEMGGERSVFHFSVTNDNSEGFYFEDLNVLFEQKENLLPSQNFDKVALISDAYVSSSIYEKAIFSNIDTISFRNLQTGAKVKHGDQLDRSTNDPLESSITKSHKLNLLKKGTVFYCEPSKTEALIDELENKNFQTIGYNHFVIIQKTIK